MERLLGDVFIWDCINSPNTCNNACYAFSNKLAPSVLTKDTKGAKKRRCASRCASKRPCGNNSQLSFKKFGDSCDEFPFASTKEGGKGAILRCVPGSDNSSQ